MRASAVLCCILGFLIVFASTGSAVPILQLYVEGASYDAASETWVAAGGDTIRLWCIGNVGGDGGKGTIYNVRLAVAYGNPGSDPVSVSLTPSTTGGAGGFTDPSTPDAPIYIQTVDDGSTPLMSDGTPLAPHDIYGEGTEWQEFLLGDFTETDSPIADFVDEFPTAGAPDEGQINVYEITVGGVSEVHFDLYDSTESPVHAWFAPFSHDAEGGGGPPVPEPGTVALLGLGGLILVGRGLHLWKRR